MRRLFAFLFFSFAAGVLENIVISEARTAFFLQVVSGIFIACFCFLEKNNRRESVIRAGFFLFVFFIGIQYPSFFQLHSALDKYAGEVIVLKGMVCSVSEKENSMRILLKSNAVSANAYEGDWKCVSARVLLTIRKQDGLDEKCLYGEEICVKGILEKPQQGKNPGMFDYAEYLKSKKIDWVMSVGYGHFEMKQNKTNKVVWLAAQFKEKGIKSLQQVLSEEKCGLLVAMLLGDKNYMEEELYESFQKNGTAHILAVSGIHVHLLYLYISRFLQREAKLQRSLLILLFLFLYATLAEFSPSVVRASLMIGIHILASLLMQRYDFFSAICFSCFLQILYNPYVICNVGFQLSYLAVYSLAVVLPWVDSRIDRLILKTGNEWIGNVGRFFSPLLVLQIMMGPMVAFYFNTFSFSAFFLNIPILFFAGMLIPIGMSLLFLCWLPYSGGFLFGIAAKSADLLLEAMLFLNELFTRWGNGYLWVVSPPYGVLILFYGILFFFCTEMHCILYRRKKVQRIYIIFTVIMLCACVLPYVLGIADVPHPFSRRLHQLTFVDVGQGDCLHIRTPDGKNILIDGGGSASFDTGKKILLPYLLKNGVDHIDLAVVTHLHTDHFKGIQELSIFMPITYLATYEGNQIREEEFSLGAEYAGKEGRMNELTKRQKIQKTETLYLKKGDQIKLDEGIWLDVLAPREMSLKEYENLFDAEDENATSLIIKVSYLNCTVLMTGDLGFEGEQSLMNSVENFKKLHCDVLKVGHHGSAYSTSEEFINAVSPSLAVIQVGKNNFGHPASRVIELFQKYDIMLARNDLDGAVFLDNLSSKTIKIEKFCK